MRRDQVRLATVKRGVTKVEPKQTEQREGQTQKEKKGKRSQKGNQNIEKAQTEATESKPKSE